MRARRVNTSDAHHPLPRSDGSLSHGGQATKSYRDRPVFEMRAPITRRGVLALRPRWLAERIRSKDPSRSWQRIRMEAKTSGMGARQAAELSRMCLVRQSAEVSLLSMYT